MVTIWAAEGEEAEPAAGLPPADFAGRSEYKKRLLIAAVPEAAGMTVLRATATEMEVELAFAGQSDQVCPVERLIDLLVQAAGVFDDTTVDLVGTIGRRVMARLMPDRRIRTRPRVVKRAISKYNARGTVDRTSYKATISIDILTTRTP
ncbi:hypothetical protein RKD29_007924 [Streptomyces tendae]|uniref:hypothetical protein n=1 Tax=Streptomyces tendae TaxID=1932 RepID=UPI00383472E4